MWIIPDCTFKPDIITKYTNDPLKTTLHIKLRKKGSKYKRLPNFFFFIILKMHIKKFFILIFLFYSTFPAIGLHEEIKGPSPSFVQAN